MKSRITVNSGNTPGAKRNKKASAKSSYSWEQLRERTAVKALRSAAMDVPAYKKFLAEKKFDAASVVNWKDFIGAPTTTKKEYLRSNQLSDLVHSGNLGAELLLYSTSSGSTGIPFYYPRRIDIANGYAQLLVEFMNLRPADSVLFIVCFGMGVWIGGTHTYEALIAAGRKKSISVIAPGVNKTEILRAVRELGPKYEQVILAGYPPFIKDIVDELKKDQASILPSKFRFIFAAEVFSEEFRDYVCTAMRCESAFLDTMNIYGTADLGAMARETPTSTMIKRLATTTPEAARQIFGGNKIPTFAQYDPSNYVFESVDGIVHVTADNALPLIRYSLGDRGGAWSFSEVEKILRSHGIDLLAHANSASIPISRQPFVFVAERDDFSVSLYGLQIYPEYFRAIFLEGLANEVTTGKFCLEIKHSGNHDQYLEVHVELKPESPLLHETDLHNLYTEIFEGLRRHSSEFKELTNHVKERQLMVVETHCTGAPPYFSGGVKQRWVL